MECPFCNINSEKTRIVDEKDFVRVIFSNPRLMPGHLLIVPKRHVERISELNKDEQKELFDGLYEKCQVFEKNIFQDLPPEELDKMLKIFSD